MFNPASIQAPSRRVLRSMREHDLLVLTHAESFRYGLSVIWESMTFCGVPGTSGTAGANLVG